MAALTGTKTETVAIALNTALAKHVPDILEKRVVGERVVEREEAEEREIEGMGMKGGGGEEEIEEKEERAEKGSKVNISTRPIYLPAPST